MGGAARSPKATQDHGKQIQRDWEESTARWKISPHPGTGAATLRVGDQVSKPAPFQAVGAAIGACGLAVPNLHDRQTEENAACYMVARHP
jgi:hypothetical protein